jgi:hypothetical protein
MKLTGVPRRQNEASNRSELELAILRVAISYRASRYALQKKPNLRRDIDGTTQLWNDAIRYQRLLFGLIDAFVVDEIKGRNAQLDGALVPSSL